MDRDRRAAFIILKDIQDNGAWSNLAVGKQFSEENPASPAFVREIVYGVLRNQYLLDYNIDSFLSKPGIKSSERILLRMGFYQMAKMDVADHAAINETVALAKALIRGKEGFINAVLRNFQRAGQELKYPEDDLITSLSIRYSAHESIVMHFIDNYGPEKAKEILEANTVPAKLAVRVNTLKTSAGELEDILITKGFDVYTSELCDNCLYVKGSALLNSKEYKQGWFSVQGEESQLAVETLSPAKDSLMLDLCAAPGGKSCAAAELMKNKGKIIAFDLYEHRIKLINKEARRLGISCIETRTADTEKFLPEFEEKADYVLADVPCSVLGTAKKNPEIKLRKLEYASLLDVQRHILENAGRYVKKGGRLVYSTCTINPFENEKQIADFMQSGNFKKLYEKQFFPDSNGREGFYICLLRKIR